MVGVRMILQNTAFILISIQEIAKVCDNEYVLFQTTGKRLKDGSCKK
jgi:hypothetical protein